MLGRTMIRGRSLLASVLLVGHGCAGSSAVARPATHHLKVSLFDVDCAECAEKVVDELRKDGPVFASSFDKKRVVLDVEVGPAQTPERLVAAAERAGFRAQLGEAGGAYLKEATAPSGSDVATPVTDGRDVVALSSLAVAGKLTIVDFYADWCGPCREVDKHVKELLSGRRDLAYRRLNIVDWDTPLAQHYLRKVPSLPYVVVFDEAGAQRDAISGLDLPRLDRAIVGGKR